MQQIDLVSHRVAVDFDQSNLDELSEGPEVNDESPELENATTGSGSDEAKLAISPDTSVSFEPFEYVDGTDRSENLADSATNDVSSGT